MLSGAKKTEPTYRLTFHVSCPIDILVVGKTTKQERSTARGGPACGGREMRRSYLPPREKTQYCGIAVR